MGSGVKKKAASKQKEFPFTPAQIEVLRNVVEERFRIHSKYQHSIASEPMVVVQGAVSAEMLDNLKKSAAEPVTISTPPTCHNHLTYPFDTSCENCGKATPSPAPTPKVSQWRNAEERCMHTAKAVQEALAVMKGIKYTIGITSFSVLVRCQGQFRNINVDFIGTKHCTMNFYRRNGSFERKEFTNTTQAAASIVAVVMYYATR